MKPAALALTCALLCAPALAPAAGPLDAPLALAVEQAVARAPSFAGHAQARDWLLAMSERLAPRVPDPFYRLELLRAVHEEASRRTLAPELVLAVIEVESGFDRHAVSATGARGLMQVMPFWKKEIGHPADNLFQPFTNLRYGCEILGHYMRMEGGNVRLALARYNGSAGSEEFPDRVLGAFHRTWGREVLPAPQTVAARTLQ